MDVWKNLLFKKSKYHNNFKGIESEDNGIIKFLTSLNPGTKVRLQFARQPPAIGTYQGFENRNVILTNFSGFPDLVRIAPHSIDAISIVNNQNKINSTVKIYI